MTEMPSYVVENPNIEPYKLKKQYNSYSSLLPILLSIFTYILVFYVLDVSPWSIFNDTKILFFISNALILIIAADYGAFTDRENNDFYGEYTSMAMRSAARENPRLMNSRYGEEIKNRYEKQEESIMGTKDIPWYLLHDEKEVPEKTISLVSEKQPRKIAIGKHEPTTTEKDSSNITYVRGETFNARNLVSPKTCTCSERRHHDVEIIRRSKTYDRSESDSKKWMIVHKGNKTEEAEEKWENVREESEEFSKMSNEELNRRVEDFIQRFNRDIKRENFV